MEESIKRLRERLEVSDEGYVLREGIQASDAEALPKGPGP